MKEKHKFIGDDIEVPDKIRRVINNGFYSEHPFKYASAQLEDYISIYEELRQLPPAEFLLCLESITTVVDGKMASCNGCFGKGLAYLKHLTKGIDGDAHGEAAERCERFSRMRNGFGDYEEDFMMKAEACGVEL